MAYKLRVTDEEIESLDYIGDRYDYAKVLVDALEPTDTDDLYEIQESDAWEFAEAVEAEDGHLPMLGGSLADRVQALLDNIV
jgi:hypothetical protein